MSDQNDRSMQDLKPTVWIGKQGCSETMIGEIVAQLKKRKLIKVKWLQNTEADPEDIALKAKARLVEVRGRTMVLAEKGKATGSGGPAGRAVAKATGKTAKPDVPAKPSAKMKARKAIRLREKAGEKAPLEDSVSAKPKRAIGSLKRAKK
jgi:RNA-binding protein